MTQSSVDGKKVKHTPIIQPSKPTLNYLLMRPENLGSHENMHKDFYINFIHNHEKQKVI